MQREKLYNLHSKSYCKCFKKILKKDKKCRGINFRTTEMWWLKKLPNLKTKHGIIKQGVVCKL